MLLNHLHSFLLLPSLVALGQSLAIQKRTARTSSPSGCLEVQGTSATSGQYSSLSSAVAALSSGSDDACIFIYAGTYEEQVSIEYGGNLTIYGYTSDTSSYSSNEVTISSSQSSAEAGTLDDSSAVNFASDGINIYNINFENAFGTASQAVAVTANGDSQGFYGCQFIGWQDTLYAKTGNQYYKSCYIEGATDFIFGDAAAWFDSCDIAAKKAGAAITANSRTLSTDDAWYVFDSCNVDAASGYSLEGEVYLGRPWRVLARVMFQSSVLSNIINAAGWTTMADNATPVFEEFNNSGDGADTSDREYTTTATAAVTQSELWGDTSWIDATY